ncbi:MAG: hypothetical protein PHT60_12235 [Acidiphilium sp.]|nr:hypothetical protein [Acidiphilium sp.]MDD4936529.1 hypothetical protein [Acidiphilium sp.]
MNRRFLVILIAEAMVNVAASTHIQTATPAAMLARVMGVLISTFTATAPVGALLGFFAVFVVLVMSPRRRSPVTVPVRDHG